nr:hypothetical protein CFP56_33455 [Quercus suber]
MWSSMTDEILQALKYPMSSAASPSRVSVLNSVPPRPTVLFARVNVQDPVQCYALSWSCVIVSISLSLLLILSKLPTSQQKYVASREKGKTVRVSMLFISDLRGRLPWHAIGRLLSCGRALT